MASKRAGRRSTAGPLVLLSCEHARADVPAALSDLGLPASVRRGHRAYDLGALPVARALAKALGARLHTGRWSRLVVDLNRSADHPLVIARRIDGRPVPGNATLGPAERAERLQRYWRGYRDRIERDVAAVVARRQCVHLSVHSFTPQLDGVARICDIGLLYDHARPRERDLVDRLRTELRGQDLSVRRNYPYFGHTDGMTSHLRRRFRATRYLGIEVELNQGLVATATGQRRCARALTAAVSAALPS